MTDQVEKPLKYKFM